MEHIFSHDFYYAVVWAMLALAVVVFTALQYVTAGYGMMYSHRWGPTVGNRIGWVLMEAPVFAAMLLLWLCSPRHTETAPSVMIVLFLLHYFQRSFVFSAANQRQGAHAGCHYHDGGCIQPYKRLYDRRLAALRISGRVLHHVWLWSPQFIAGTLIFFAGMGINIQSDSIVRSLRKPGDTRHYIPRGGMYRYVTWPITSVNL